MKFSECKAIKSFCANLHSEPAWFEVAQNVIDGTDDFEVDNVRFIKSECIDSILVDELGNDDYILGCFNAWFVADVTGIDTDVIEAMQKVEAYEAIGKLIKSLGKLEELATAYASADGYGHHFNGYDFGEEELRIAGQTYHVFDNH
jgi:hypothetical protein